MVARWDTRERVPVSFSFDESGWTSLFSRPDEPTTERLVRLLDGDSRASFALWAGEFDEPMGAAFIQLEGSADAMTVVYGEVDESGARRRFARAHDAVGDDPPVVIAAGGAYTVGAPRSQLFTADEAIEILGDYLMRFQLPDPAQLREVEPVPGPTRTFAKTVNDTSSAFLTDLSRSYLDQLRHDLGRMRGVDQFAYCVWAVPPRVRTWRGLYRKQGSITDYLQSAGSASAMTVELRATQDDGSVDHWVVGKPGGSPSGAPDARVRWRDDLEEVVRPHEVFTSEEAARVYFSYLMTLRPPEGCTLRRLDGLSTSRT